jgi:hypothetical protein
MYVGVHVKSLLFLSDFNHIWNVPTNFSKLPNFMKTFSAVLELLYLDRRTDIQVYGGGSLRIHATFCFRLP